MLPNTEIKQQEPTKQAPTTEADAPPSANEKKNVTYGFLVGLLAAICYGFIPFFTLPIKSGAAENFMSARPSSSTVSDLPASSWQS